MKLDFKVIPAGRWVEPHGKILPVPEYQVLSGYARDDGAIARARETAGFFALMTLGKDLDPVQALEQYKIRDEQEKYFSQMKTQMLCDRQRNSSEDGKAGRAFIQFIGLILSSYLRHIWKTTKLHGLFGSSLEILDEMRSIRCIEYETQNMVTITPFTGRQLDVCRVFGFEVPGGSDVEVQKTPGKRGPGRPKGSKNKKKS